MKKLLSNIILTGLFLVLSGSLFIQCSPKKSQISEKEWDALPTDGPTLSTFERVFCSTGATESELYAAMECIRLFQELTGKELALDRVGTQTGNIIFIGPDAAATAVDTATMNDEEFKIEIAMDKIAIYGGPPRGTLYGVYEFFEKYCGVRYLTADHTFYPVTGKDKDFRIKRRSHRYNPPFSFRWSYYGETNRHPAFAAQLRTNTVSGPEKFGGITGYKLVGHNVAYLVPPAMYGKEHPEYYALVNGRRVLDLEGGGPQLRMTNPDVLDIVVKATLDAIEKNPEIKNYNRGLLNNRSRISY